MIRIEACQTKRRRRFGDLMLLAGVGAIAFTLLCLIIVLGGLSL